MADSNGDHSNKVKDFNVFLEMASLGLAGVCLLIIVGVLTVQLPLNPMLTWAIRFASVALPLFFAIYMAKDEASRLLQIEHPMAIQRLTILGYVGVAGLFLLGGAIVCIVAHYSAGLALVVLFMLLGSGELSRWLAKTKI
ncbi:hypothetical protein [Burkholderia vietnamiensis]|uniref:hypothetical protein n=1 Tax=Burkholderia vietnamiensis TaxID=60552 RepID=UPI0015892F14|nr:hypothetical protein [Burkholderia vietnamiensis]